MRLVVTEVGGPGLANPFAGPDVIRQEHLVACGTEYQEGVASMEQCACGTFAIGRCAQCGAPICGSHSGLWDGRRLCERDLVEARTVGQARDREARLQRDAEAAEHAVRRREAWLAAARATLDESDDPAERIVRVVAALSPSDPRRARSEDAEQLVRQLLPERTAGDPNERWWWDHDAVQAWFLRAVRTPPKELEIVRVRRPVFGRTKRQQTTTPGWSFPGGATRSWGEPGTPTHGYATVSILADGRRMIEANVDAGPQAGFNERALASMAERAQLRPLPPFAPVGFEGRGTGAHLWTAEPGP